MVSPVSRTARGIAHFFYCAFWLAVGGFLALAIVISLLLMLMFVVG